MISAQCAVLSWQLRTSVFKLNFCLHNKPRFSFLSFSSLYLISRVACIVYRRLNIILYQCGLWRWLIWSLWGSSSLSLYGKYQIQISSLILQMMFFVSNSICFINIFQYLWINLSFGYYSKMSCNNLFLNSFCCIRLMCVNQ